MALLLNEQMLIWQIYRQRVIPGSVLSILHTLSCLIFLIAITISLLLMRKTQLRKAEEPAQGRPGVKQQSKAPPWLLQAQSPPSCP